MTTSTAGPSISNSGVTDMTVNSGKVPGQREVDNFSPAPVSPDHKNALARHRSLDEQTATDIAAGW